MTKKPTAPAPRSERVDPYDPPELTDEWFRGAYVYHGDKLIRRREGPTREELFAEALNKGKKA